MPCDRVAAVRAASSAGNVDFAAQRLLSQAIIERHHEQQIGVSAVERIPVRYPEVVMGRQFLRRDMLRLTIAGAIASHRLLSDPVAARPVDLTDKRRPRYQADSAEVRNFYRVNSYPRR